MAFAHHAPNRQLRASLYLLAILCLLLALPLPAKAEKHAQVRLQLGWQHQFQFAGYYAAIAQGYYREAGLEVILKEGGGYTNVIDEVLTRRSEYGVAGSELLLKRLEGKPVVALAAIFQHSPLVFITRRETGISSVADFAGKTLKMSSSTSIELRAALASERLSLDTITLVDGVPTRRDYFDPKIDVVAGYRTNHPYYLAKEKVLFTLIKPSTYGVDFYGDCLFTSEEEIRENPDRVRAFREASLRGWHYALEHPEEIITLITEKYQQRKDPAHLAFEAREVQRLILPELIEIGHMHPGRWQHIASIFAKFNEIPEEVNLAGFLYNPEQEIRPEQFFRYLGSLSVITLVLLIVTVILVLMNRRLQREIQVGREAERALQESERKLQSYSRQTEQFSLSAAAMLTIQDEKKLFTEIADAIVEHSDFKRVLISLFRDEQPYRELIGFAGVSAELVDKVRKTDLAKSWYDNVFSLGVKIGNFSYYVPHYLSHILNQEATIYGNGEVPEDEKRWHPKDNLFVRMNDEQGRFLGIISVDNSKSGLKPTAEIVRPLEIYASLISQIIILRREFNRRTQLENQLQQSQKMEAIGNLTGGIAHDFNNILGIIIGNAEMALLDSPDASPISKNVREIKNASLRAKDIIQQLLSFNRKSQTEKRPIALEQTVDGVIKILRPSIPNTVQFSWHSKLGSVMVSADPPLIYQVLMNLIANSVTAMGDKGGDLTISGDTEHLDPQRAGSLDLPTGNYATITVADSGPGIPPELRERIFEPYFTTAEPGGSSGLGLSAAHGIMKIHSGAIGFSSTAGKGTAFTLYFPCLAEQDAPSPVAKTARTAPGTILLIDDEPSLLDVTKKLLTRNGYQVEATDSPREALRLFSAEPQKFRLVITDMTMGDMNGLELVAAIHQRSPAIPVFLCSGFSDKINQDIAGEAGISRYFPKPLDSEAFLAAVRDFVQS